MFEFFILLDEWSGRNEDPCCFFLSKPMNFGPNLIQVETRNEEFFHLRVFDLMRQRGAENNCEQIFFSEILFLNFHIFFIFDEIECTMQYH